MRQTDGIWLRACAQQGEPQASRAARGALLALSLAAFFTLWGLFQSMCDQPLSTAPAFTGIALVLLQWAAGKSRRSMRIANGALILCAVLIAVLLPDELADGLKGAVNALFAASARHNAYVYDMLPVSPGAGESARRLGSAALAALAALAGGLLVRRRSGTLTVGAFLLAALAQVYFGLTPSVLWNAALLAVLGILLLRCAGAGEAASAGGALPGACALLLAAAALLLLLTAAIYPGENPRLTGLAEALRDRLGASESLPAGISGALEEDFYNPVRPERPLREEPAREEALAQADYTQYARVYDYVAHLSRPRSTSHWKTALLALLILALLVGPFVPFYWADACRRKVQARRADFESADCARAVACQFRALMEWLEIAGLQTDDRQFSAYEAPVRALMGDAYAKAYAQAVLLWQEARYSEHEMTQDARARMQALLDQTAKTVWARAKRRQRFHIRYVHHLDVPEENNCEGCT